MKSVTKSLSIKRLLFLLFVALLAACSLEKKSGFNRRMQNLTAHYNILFNAKELLKQKQASLATGFIDNYTEILSVYQDTSAGGEDKDLQAAITKANTIINFKEQSKYLGDAYLVLGKANYLNKDFFNALEFFNYVLRSYNTNPDLVEEALVWKARTLLQLQQIPEAKLMLDTAILNVNPKKSITADVYATKLQYDINEQEYTDAEEMAKLAIQYCGSTMQKLRWTFILAQIQELNGKPAEAMAHYTRVVKSNAPFEMAFNADLNRIRIEDMRDGVKVSRIDRLKSLIRNENNKDFLDQIYYQIAQIYFTEGDVDKAIENYKLSAKFSQKNQNQKGLSYLRLADINFKNKVDYVNAKKYYDSTLLNLSPNYPGYITIKKKSENLQLLTDNLNIISHEDTIQALARLDDKARAVAIDSMVKSHTVQQQQIAAAADNLAASTQTDNQNDNANPQASVPNGNSFYFYNNKAVSQGFTVFKRKWGNRRLEDNWRRSQRSNSNITANTSPAIDPSLNPGQQAQRAIKTDSNTYKQQLVQSLPITPLLMAQSNERVENAYLNIGNFYRDIVEDSKEAIASYETLLRRFPDEPNKAPIYYSLYRLYTPINTAKAEEYKNLLLKNYGDTPYAKVILDPDYGQRMTDENSEFNGLYNQVYDLYAKRQYTEVIKQADALQKQFPNNRLGAQLLYLRALANGHQVKVTPFKADLIQLVSKYPNDPLITPLVNQHVNYIDSNSVEMARRKFAVLDTDSSYIPFAPQDIKPLASNFAQVADKRAPVPLEKPKAKPAADKTAAVKPAAPAAQQPVTQPDVAPVAITEHVKPKKVYIFNESDSTNYYFVVNVASNTTNLASSRFGIGQFNRTRYQDKPIKHQLKNVGANQLVYVGRFNTLDEVRGYARSISPLMGEIMKVPKDKYTFFIITQQNLDKLADKNLLDTYYEYYQDNF